MTKSQPLIRVATVADAPAIAEIYNYYVLHTHITFETEPVSSEEIAGRMQEAQPTYPWLACERDGLIEGYAYASQWKSRCSYRRSAETTIYLDKTKVGSGTGFQLYGELIRVLKSTGDLHTLIGGIALPNSGSAALHEKLGFEKVAHFKDVGWKFDRWIDVGYWQLIF